MRFVILLLFALAAGTITDVARGDQTAFTGEVASVDVQGREIVVTPAPQKRDAGVYDKKNLNIHVRLGWDSSMDKSFDLLLPPCVFPGNKIRVSGTYLDDSLFLAETVQGCGSGNFSDKTGVRARLNRSRRVCGP